MKTQTETAKPKVIIAMTKLEDIRSRRHDTIAGERDGSLTASLATESDEDLARHMFALRCSSHWSNPVFGGSFKRWMAHIASELERRGVDAVAYPGLGQFSLIRISKGAK